MDTLVYGNTCPDYYVRITLNKNSKKYITWTESTHFYYYATVTFIIQKSNLLEFKQSVYDWIYESFTKDQVHIIEPDDFHTFYTAFISDISLIPLFKLAY